MHGARAGKRKKVYKMRNLLIVLLVLGAIWWAVENPSTAKGAIDSLENGVQKIVDAVTD